jgi:uncharacterized protein
VGNARDGFELKLLALGRCLRDLGSAAIAYSGGVDSTVLLHAARAALGERAVGAIADSPSLARRELEEALAVARSFGCEPVVLATRELEDPRYAANSGERCYFCKRALFDELARLALERGLAALCFGEIADDALDLRPGARAARELAVHAPLAACGFTKDDVRRYARESGLSVAEKAASACLASRLPVGTVVTRERLARVERAEEALRALGLRALRVRDHGPRARVEVGRGELERADLLRPAIARALRPLGFAELELAAYVPPYERARAAQEQPT